MEGDSVTLQTETHCGRGSGWFHWYNDNQMFSMIRDWIIKCTYDWCNERFRDRLKLDHQTGSLTITNTRTTDSGLYKVILSTWCDSEMEKIFNVSVHGESLC